MDANEVLKRRNLRGLVKCKVCQFYNGIRATACKNKNCILSKVEVKRKIKPKINAIELVTDGDSKLFSVQVRDRDVDNRNFVSVTDKIISSDASASIISRNAICYVDTCKYDSNDVNISCKHVKSSLEFCTIKARVQKIDEGILTRIQMSEERRMKLLNMHKELQSTIPLVQRINPRVFVVRCDASLSFPIGLLHVVCNVEPNGVHFSCACKKMKDLVSINQSNLVGKDICEHILLILAAILSDLNLQKEFEDLLTTIKPLFSQANGECQWISDEITSVPIATAYNDLSSSTIGATLVENLDNIELIQIPNVLTEGENLSGSLFSLEQCNVDNIQSVDMENLPIAVESENIPVDDQLNCGQYSDGLELVNYKVELMDQFEFHNEQSNAGHSQGTLSVDGIYGIDDQTRSTDVVLSYLYPEDLSIDDLPMEVMETSEKPMSSNECLTQSHDDGCTEHEKICRNLDDTQLESYINWLNSVIETTNLILDFNNDGYPDPLIFSVPHLYFDIFRTKFSAGTKKKRLPNQTTVLTDGKYKNLTMFTWIFSNIKLIKYILSTRIMELEVVRSFRKTSQNTFEYVNINELNKTEDNIGFEGNNRKIRPTMYKTFLKVKSLENNSKFQNKASKQGLFVIEWIPNALPISKYGEMRIKLQFGHMKNDTIC